MKILVTGALGLIGSHIAHQFVAAGHDVFGCDDHSPPARVQTTSWIHIPRSIESLWDGHNAYYQAGDLDLIVHCAGPVGPVGILNQRGTIARRIMSATEAAARMAIESKAYLINFSTSEVYGFNGLYREDNACLLHPGYEARREYAIGKLAAESMVAGLCHAGDLRAVSLRPFNVTGPEQSAHKGFVFPRFADQTLRGEPLTVYGDGSLRRSFLGADDMARFVTEHYEDVKRAVQLGEPINVGNLRNATTIAELADLFKDVANEDLDIGASPTVHVDPMDEHGTAFAEADGREKLPDITEARSLGWEPSRTLRDLVSWVLQERQAMRLHIDSVKEASTNG